MVSKGKYPEGWKNQDISQDPFEIERIGVSARLRSENQL